ncbi:MAG: sensor domain-containing diguanylate cyclase [Proteobacteria bacterium]|nr:sensor domain-containing diguanylate cyclase [Pseudomonadota bacterium]
MASNDVGDFQAMFELAPVSLWLEDYSGLKALYARWRADGVSDLRGFLQGDRARVAECSREIRLLGVNRRTLELFEADSAEQLVANMDRVLRDDTAEQHVNELAALWDGAHRFSGQTVNYTLSGKRLDIQLNASVLPGHEDDWARVLVAIEDISDRVRAERASARSAAYAQGLFEHSPVSLWVEDFSVIKRLIDDLRERGIEDFRVFTNVHPEFVERCMQEIRVIDVNRHTLTMFRAPDKPTLLRNLDQVFRDEMRPHFTEQLVDLWNGKLFQQREVVNHRLDGELLNVHLQFSVLPGAEDDWSLVQVALTDITARKKAEAYLEFLGKHDVLTQLRNRGYFEDELNRLERRGPFPVTVVVVDLDGLKQVNDQHGHAVGDALLRRTGEVLAKLAERQVCAARIGGDEFVLLMPAADEDAGRQMMDRITSLVELNNQFYPGVPLSLSMGCATATSKGERLENTVSRADAQMYESKRIFYAGQRDRRNTQPGTL